MVLFVFTAFGLFSIDLRLGETIISHLHVITLFHYLSILKVNCRPFGIVVQMYDTLVLVLSYTCTHER